MTAQPTLFDRLPARLSDPPTSKAQPAKKAVASQAAVLSALQRCGAMHDKMLVTVVRYRQAVESPMARKFWSASRIRSARAELVRMGKVQDSGQTVKDGGSTHTIWKLSP